MDDDRQPRDDVEELEQGSGRDTQPAPGLAEVWERIPRTVRGVVVAGIGAAVGILAVTTVQGRANPKVVQPTHSAPPTLAQSSLLQAEDVCTALHGDTLEVSFRLTNVGQRPLTVVGVRPSLPLGMLLTLPTDLTDPGCLVIAPQAPGGLLQPGGSQPVTFRLVSLVQCAQPAPVEASIDLAGQVAPTTTIPVLADLGSVDFPGCSP